jgi:hypothetical protein
MKDISKYAASDSGFCEGKCLKRVINTETSSTIVCDGCNRIIIVREKKK